MRRLTAAALVLGLAGPAAAEPWSLAPAEAGAWSGRLQLGWPWSALTVQRGLSQRLGLELDLHSALLGRHDAQLGPTLSLLRAERLELQAAALAGAVVQPGDDAGAERVSGPQLEASLRAAVPMAVSPWLRLSSQHLFAVHDTIRTDADGSSRERAVEHRWTPWLGLGAALPLGDRLALEAGLDVVMVDGSFSIPGAHLALWAGGAP
jgi:hypothetical protein